MNEQDAVYMIQDPINEGTWNKVSNNTILLDGNIAYETVLVGKRPLSNEILKDQGVSLIKNRTIYGVNFIAPEKTFDTKKTNFDTVINSFKIK